MTRPVTEVAFADLLPDAIVAESLAAIETILYRQEGIRRIWWGFFPEDRTKIMFIGNWDDITCHWSFEQSESSYPAVSAILAGILAGPVQKFHVHLDQDTLCRVLEAPAVEVYIITCVSENFQSNAQHIVSVGCSAHQSRGFVHGPVVEKIGHRPGDTVGSAHFAAVAWDSLNFRTSASVLETEMYFRTKAEAVKIHHAPPYQRHWARSMQNPEMGA
ncbi:hypothetical protein BDW72DRAFT_195478 [Aspergillus terricola var. indicus]